MYRATTRHITVTVTPAFLPEPSDPEEGRWVFSYRVEIENGSRETVQLRARHWVITDGRGARHSVEGEGVVGEQPVIEPGASFDYVSGCPLATPSGAMQGTYRMVRENGAIFDVEIPRFALLAPAVLH